MVTQPGLRKSTDVDTCLGKRDALRDRRRASLDYLSLAQWRAVTRYFTFKLYILESPTTLL
jgi:hypothetical protein